MNCFRFSLVLIALVFLFSCGSEPKKTEVNPPSTTDKLVETVAPEKDLKKPVEELKEKIEEKAKDELPVITVPPRQLEKAKKILSSIDAEAIKAVDAKRKYKQLCGICHGTKGNLNVNGAKDLTKSIISLEESVAQVYFGKGLMTAYKGILKDAEIVAVAKYIETMRK